VIGTEMGALIGSVYSFSSNINQFEWNLLKLKENAFQESNGFLSQWRNTSMSGEKLESQLKQILENKDLKSARIPMRIGVAIEHAPASHKEETKVLDQGNVVSTIRASMSSQGVSKGFFAPIKWNQAGEKVKVTSTEKTHPFLVEEAKRIATGPIVVVDVMGPPQSGLVMDELKGADLVIRPDMRGIQAKDFQKKTDAAFRGKNAIIQHMAEIRHLVGMSGAVD
jgi:predicted acylesterase/phospholipase RssA